MLSVGNWCKFLLKHSMVEYYLDETKHDVLQPLFIRNHHSTLTAGFLITKGESLVMMHQQLSLTGYCQETLVCSARLWFAPLYHVQFLFLGPASPDWTFGWNDSLPLDSRCPPAHSSSRIFRVSGCNPAPLSARNP